MSIISEIIRFISWFIEIYLLMKLFETVLYNKKRNDVKNLDILIAFCGSCLLQICSHTTMIMYFTRLVFIWYVSIGALILYKANIIAFLSISSFYRMCLTFVEMITIIILSNFNGSINNVKNMISKPSFFSIFYMIYMILILFILFYMTKKLLTQLLQDKKKIYVFILTAFIETLGFINFVNESLIVSHQPISPTWLLLIGCISLISFMVYFLSRYRQENMKLKFVEMRNHLLEENYNVINDLYMSHAKLYHDMNNHLNALYQLIDLGNTEEAKEYIQEISKPTLKRSNIIWTGIDVVDVVINSKLEEMRKKGIEADIDVEFPNNSNIRSNDICTILANLLDNAIEATEKIDGEKKISLVIRRVNHFIIMKITNTNKSNEQEFTNFPNTTKADKEFHGWGLPSVLATIEKYNGSMKCENHENEFTVTILLFYEAQ